MAVFFGLKPNKFGRGNLKRRDAENAEVGQAVPDKPLNTSRRTSIRPVTGGDDTPTSFFGWKATVQFTQHHFGNRLRRGCQAQPDLRDCIDNASAAFTHAASATLLESRVSSGRIAMPETSFNPADSRLALSIRFGVMRRVPVRCRRESTRRTKYGL